MARQFKMIKKYPSPFDEWVDEPDRVGDTYTEDPDGWFRHDGGLGRVNILEIENHQEYFEEITQSCT